LVGSEPGGAPALGQAQLPQGRALNIGVDDSRPSAIAVYVVNHGT
jgi:hypothetical protein